MAKKMSELWTDIRMAQIQAAFWSFAMRTVCSDIHVRKTVLRNPMLFMAAQQTVIVDACLPDEQSRSKIKNKNKNRPTDTENSIEKDA